MFGYMRCRTNGTSTLAGENVNDTRRKGSHETAGTTV